MIKSGIFDSTSVEMTESGLARGNKAVDAAFLSTLLSSLVSSGIFANVGEAFRSHAAGGNVGDATAMKIITENGALMIDGHFAYDTTTETRSFNISTEDRLTARFYRLNLENGTIYPYWKDCIRQNGKLVTIAENQTLPVRNGNLFDLVTMIVEIPAGTAAITDDMITDLRANPDYCGFVTSVV